GLEQRRERRPDVRAELLDVAVRRAPEPFLHVAKSERRVRGNARGELARSREQLGVRDDTRHEADSLRLARVDHVPGEEQLGGPRMPDDLRQPPEAAEVGDEAAL